jgi:hypothetical protein
VLFDDKGDSVLIKDFLILPQNRYILSFAGIQCPGIYFICFTIGDQTFTQLVVLNKSSSPSRSPQQVNFETSVVDGVWERSYSQIVFPSISIPEEQVSPKSDTVNHQIVMRLFRHTYEIEWITRSGGGGIQTEKYKGSFLINADTITFFDAQTDRFYQFHVNSDTLTLNVFRKPTESYVFPVLHPTSPMLILEGIYQRRSLEK